MADPQLPRVQAQMLDGGGYATREWYDFFRDLVSVASEGVTQEAQIAALEAAVQALEDASSNLATLLGPASVNVAGTLAGGSVTFRLVNDLESPGNTYRYGTGPTGTKGWHLVADDLLEGTGIEFTVGSDGVITIALDAASIASLALADTAVQPADLSTYAPLADPAFTGAVGLPSYTVATLPSATPAGRLIYVTDESGGAVPAFSDATNWRRVTDRAIVS